MRWSNFVHGYGNATQEEVRAAMEEGASAQTYTITITNKQIIINWGDERRFYSRNEKGRAAAEHCKARLRAQGIYEADV